MDLGLTEKVALISGASGSIGSGIARVLAQEGANIVINYNSNSEAAHALVNEIKCQYGVKAIAIQANIAIEEEVITLYNTLLDEFGTIDILINNAGAVGHKYPKCAIEDIRIADLRESDSIMIEGLFIMSREFIRHCKKQNKNGHIVNMLSKSAYWSSSINNTIYATGKGATAFFTKALAHEVSWDGFYVNAVIPGYIVTARTDTNSERYAETARLIPGGRYGKPEELGYIVAFLCSEKACLINGASIDCTGGTLNGEATVRK